MSVLVAVDDAAARHLPDHLQFVTPPPGMMTLRDFTLDALDEVGALFAMRSTESDGVRLFVVPPRVYVPEYSPRIDAATREALELGDDAPVFLVVVHPGKDGEPPTANLLAPVAVNPRTGGALQVVLEDDWPLRAPLVAA